jgi:hypothetical protein
MDNEKQALSFQPSVTKLSQFGGLAGLGINQKRLYTWLVLQGIVGSR